MRRITMNHLNRRWHSVLCLIAMLSVAGGVGAQELDGTWDVTISAPEGSHSFTITLVTDGEKVTGTRGQDSYTGTFKDGKSELSGEHYIAEAGNGALLEISDVFDGAQIKGDGSWAGFEATFVAKQAK